VKVRRAVLAAADASPPACTGLYAATSPGVFSKRGTMRAELLAVRMRTPGQLAQIAVRLVLVGGLAFGWANLLTKPQDTTIGQLLEDVRDGRTASVTVERPREGALASGLDVHWSTGFLQGWVTSDAVRPGNGAFAPTGNDVLGELRQAAASARRPVQIRTVPQTIPHSYTDWAALFVLLTFVLTLVLLVAGPAPTIATRWAWFWLGTAVPLSWAVFLLAEPWFSRDRGRAGTRRLTGGWAFLLGLVITAIASALLPRFRGILFSSRTGPAG
jgi:hypothetical protein